MVQVVPPGAEHVAIESLDRGAETDLRQGNRVDARRTTDEILAGDQASDDVVDSAEGSGQDPDRLVVVGDNA
ncbi:hypothetical protein GCM10027062_15060 [Nocardioides hungaricus]